MAGTICMRDNIITTVLKKVITGIHQQSGVTYILILIFLFVQGQSGFGQSIRSKVNEGNSQYHEEKYEEALNNYQDALLDDPKNNIAIFNQGDALYKLKKYEKAIESYQKIVGSEDRMIDSKAYYNIGNAYFKQDKLQESIQSYIRALDLNPDDHDAKYNLELARAKLKEMADKQQQQPQQSGQQQQGQGNENQEGEDEQQSQAEQQQAEQSSGEEEGEEEQQNEGLEESEEKMTKEDAERILDALKNDEQDTQKLRKPVSSGKRNVDKDW
jgi:tetratricopeptide (TPR) repeat protein